MDEEGVKPTSVTLPFNLWLRLKKVVKKEESLNDVKVEGIRKEVEYREKLMEKKDVKPKGIF